MFIPHSCSMRQSALYEGSTPLNSLTLDGQSQTARNFGSIHRTFSAVASPSWRRVANLCQCRLECPLLRDAKAWLCDQYGGAGWALIPDRK